MSTQTSTPARDEAGFELATGRLFFGIEYEGKRHHDFTMRLPTMADNIAAIEAYPEAIGTKLEIAMFARCMVKLGDIPRDAITYELLVNGLLPIEHEAITDAMGVVKKKLLDAQSNLSPTDK